MFWKRVSQANYLGFVLKCRFCFVGMESGILDLYQGVRWCWCLLVWRQFEEQGVNIQWPAYTQWSWLYEVVVYFIPCVLSNPSISEDPSKQHRWEWKGWQPVVLGHHPSTSSVSLRWVRDVLPATESRNIAGPESRVFWPLIPLHWPSHPCVWSRG